MLTPLIPQISSMLNVDEISRDLDLAEKECEHDFIYIIIGLLPLLLNMYIYNGPVSLYNIIMVLIYKYGHLNPAL